MNIESFIVGRNDLRRTMLVSEPAGELASGDLFARVDRFALTANNLTYAEMGDSFAFWQFFPAPEGWGSIPAWGFADVLESLVEGIEVGERIYGFLPMSTHVALRPQRVGVATFVDASPHRVTLPAAYNLYWRCAADPLYRKEDEDLLALLRPVFITSFLLDDMFADEEFFGARRVLISSASSKTAFGLAHLIHARSRVEVVGLTSPGNRHFVSTLGCYDAVYTYDQIADLAPSVASIYVDFAGNAAVTAAVHERLREALRFSSAVGFTHRQLAADEPPPVGIRPVQFVAFERLKKRAKDWGRSGIDERFAERWSAFVPSARTWLRIVHGQGAAAVEAVYAAALNGRIEPQTGHVLGMAGSA